MINNETIGVGITTCNRPKRLSMLLESLTETNPIDHLVVVDDSGADTSETPTLSTFTESTVWIKNAENRGVAYSKNKCLERLAACNCDYFFLIEDDMLVKDPTVFERYIQAHKLSGIHHFNYGPGSPFNRVQTIPFDLHNRHLLDQTSEPNPRLIVEYDADTKVCFYLHTVAMFSFFTKKCLHEVGLLDEQFYNAWEHVDHTQRIAHAGFHTPFWWFADIWDSTDYLSEQPDAINESTIANNSETWAKNVMDGREKYKLKHGFYPNHAPNATEEEVLQFLRTIRNSSI